MWQLYVLAALFSGALESIIDKKAIVAQRMIDPVIATFWRLVCFAGIAVAIGYLGFLGGLTFAFPPLIILAGVLAFVQSLVYTVLLRRLEITTLGAFFYLAPFLFLYIDTAVLNVQFSALEILGIVLVVLGGFAFAIDGKSHHFKRELSIYVWLLLLFVALHTGVDAYIFKQLHATEGLSPLNFYANSSIVALALLAVTVVAQGKTRLLLSAPSRSYIPHVFISKGFAVGRVLLWGSALSLVSVSQVTAMGAFEPLILFLCTAFLEIVFGWRLAEKLGKARLEWKALSVCMLVIGGLLIS